MSLGTTLPPAPIVKRIPKQIDLGKFDEEYTGWIVRVNPTVSLALNDIMARMSSESDAPQADKLTAMQEWIKAAFLEWNFVDDEGTPLHQPRAGGATQLPLNMLELLSLAFVEALKPSDPSSRQ